MNPKVKIVIGANYGDEGKGLVTASLAQKAKENGKILNVLFNGGPQRGHTVEYSNGFRHIFHHFGSGFCEGAQTYFDEDFMIYPIFFRTELDKLHLLAKRKEYDFWNNYEKALEMYISYKCRVITPWDAFTNILIEKSRSNEEKHGSCGLGIWETQQRYLYGTKDEKIPYGKLVRMSIGELKEYFLNVRSYAKSILNSYGITDYKNYAQFFEEDKLIDKVINDLYFVGQYCRTVPNITIRDFQTFAQQFETIIFEGGQGLALDEDNDEALPYVTASKTGANIPLRRCLGLSNDIEVCYVSRSYFTRHGAGPFPTECSNDEIQADLVDNTNLFNPFQGSFRYGKLNAQEILDRISIDISKWPETIRPRTHLFMTQMNYSTDQSDKEIEILSREFNEVTYIYKKELSWMM